MSEKLCANCKNPLPTSLDEFGDWEAPVCQACFLKGIGTAHPQLDELRDVVNLLKAELANAEADCVIQEAELERCQEAIDQCSDKDGIPIKYINDRDQEEKWLLKFRSHRDELKDRLFWAEQRVKRYFENEKNRMRAWTQAVKGPVNA